MADPYCYPGTETLINRFDIRDPDRLDEIERLMVARRIMQGTPAGGFDLAHLQAIHHHLFQDVYDWAGQVRTVEIAKGETHFLPCRFIERGMVGLHQRLRTDRYLQGLPAADFIGEAARVIGDINHAHPFREGNGRTQLLYLEQLAEQAGHPLDLTRLHRDQWIEASIASNFGDLHPMQSAIDAALIEPEDAQQRYPETDNEPEP